ncbi:acylphosphatase [Patescibacteria group bacterium]|nr:acylphosphatase [Patescibacteria group bacterium]
MSRVHLIISGQVQGVGFRSWVGRFAEKKTLTGWVRNRQDGAVEIVAEGGKQDLDALIVVCRRGPEPGWVDDVSVRWLSATGEFHAFAVLY